MGIDLNTLNPVTGQPFAWNEYHSYDDTILVTGLTQEAMEAVCTVAQRLRVKILACMNSQDLLAIPAFMVFVNPNKIPTEDIPMLVDLWQEIPVNELMVVFTEQPCSCWPEHLPSCVRVDSEIFVDTEKLRLRVLKQKTLVERQERMTRQYEQRIFRILTILKRMKQGPVKTRDLAKEFKVSPRTV